MVASWWSSSSTSSSGRGRPGRPSICCSSPSPPTPHPAASRRAAPPRAASERGAFIARPGREAHDEAGAAAGAVLDPRLAALGRGVLGDEGEAEAGADAVAGRAAAGEALEDAHPLAAGHAGPASSTATSRNGPSVGSIEMRTGPPPWWTAFSSRLARIRSKRSLSTTAVCGARLPAVVTSIGEVGEAVAGGDPPAQRLDVDLLGVQVGRPGVDARQLEEVDHHGVEAAHLADDDVERLLGAVGQLAAPAVDDLGGGGEGGDRRAQLVADVGGEAGLPLDAGLHGVGHVVERVGEPVEVGVALGGAGSRSPAAISPAASVIRASGRSRRRLVHHPTPVARSTVTAEPMSRAMRIVRSVRSVGPSWNASK